MVVLRSRYPVQPSLLPHCITPGTARARPPETSASPGATLRPLPTRGRGAAVEGFLLWVVERDDSARVVDVPAEIPAVIGDGTEDGVLQGTALKRDIHSGLGDGGGEIRFPKRSSFHGAGNGSNVMSMTAASALDCAAVVTS